MAIPEPTSSRSHVIGMLGGMSWQSSAAYYRLVNEVVRDRLGGLHSARCVLASIDFAVIEEMQVTPTVTVADQIQAAIGIPLLHIADVTAQARELALQTR